MSWLEKHADTIVVMITIIASICGSLIWMNGKFNEIEKDLAVVKTVLIMKNIMPKELAQESK